MKLREIAETLRLEVLAGAGGLDREVSGGYTGDLLSDVMANSREGEVWITIQSHLNVVAVGSLKELAGIIVIGGKTPSGEVLEKAEAEGLPLLRSELSAYEVSGRLHRLLNG